MANQKSNHRVIVDVAVNELFDQMRYADSAMVRERCIRAYEVQCGFKLNPFARGMAEHSINYVLGSVWASKGFIPSNRVDIEPIQGVPQFLAIKKDVGWVRTRWDWTRPEDWDSQLSIMVENKKSTDKALDEFQQVYDYVVPLMESRQLPLGKLVQIEFDWGKLEDAA